MGTKSCSFDDDRDGFIMGEGAGCFILESEEKAKKMFLLKCKHHCISLYCCK